MAVQTVVIDVFQTNKKLKEFDKNVDRLGKSLEKMQKQMERLNQEKRSTGLSQGDTLMKSLDKMTSTMTRIFSNGIKLNNPTITAKVTVDFSKMNLAGQMGVALKNADIAGMIIRNLPRSRMGVTNTSALKVNMPNKMEVTVANKELQVKLPKNFSNGVEKEKKQGFVTRAREAYEKNKSIYYKKKVDKGDFRKKLDSMANNMEKNWDFLTEGIPEAFKNLKHFPREFTGIKNTASKIWTGFKGLSFGGKLAIGAGGIGAGIFGMASLELKAFAFTVKAVSGIINGVIGVFQKIAGIASAVWGQAQQWVFNPMVQTQNQISENKGYKMLLGGEDKAIEFDNSIFEMSEKSSFSHEALDSSARMFLSKGVSADETKRRLSLAQDTAAAFSLDDSGFQEITNGISQLSAKKNVYIEDVTQGFGNTIPTLKLITEGINKEAKGTKKSMDEIKDAIENGDYSGGELVEALLKGMETYGGTAEEIANTTFMGLKTKISNIFKSNVLKNWGKGLSDGFTTGFSKIADWIDKNQKTFEKWGNSIQEIGKEVSTAISNIVLDLGDRFNKAINSEKFKNADLSGKIVIIWDEVFKEPFIDWWNSTGRDFFSGFLSGSGNGLGEVFTGFVCGLLGSHPEGVVSEGFGLGASFATGLLDGIDGGAIGEAILNWISDKITAPFESLKGLWDDFCDYISGKSSSTYVPITYLTESTDPEIENAKYGVHEDEGTNPKLTQDSEVEQGKEKYKEASLKGSEKFYKDTKKLGGDYDNVAELSKERKIATDYYTRAINSKGDPKELEGLANELHEKYGNQFNYTGENFNYDALAGIRDVKIQEEEKAKTNLEEKIDKKEGTFQREIEKATVLKQKVGENEKDKEKFDDNVNQANIYLNNMRSYGLQMEHLDPTSQSYGEFQEKYSENLKKLGAIMQDGLEIRGDDIKLTRSDPNELEKLIENKEKENTDIWAEDKIALEEAMKGINNFRDIKTGLIHISYEDEMNQPLQEAMESFDNLDKEPKDFLKTKLQQVDLLNQQLLPLAEPLYKDIIIRAVYDGKQDVYNKFNALGGDTSQNPPPDSSEEGNIGNNAKGNILMSPQLSWVAEAGPEAIIPLTGPYKKRGIGLWEQAGQMLGVTPKYGKGGIIGSYEIPKETPRLYQQIEETQTAKETETKMNMPPQIQTGDMNFNFTFHGTDTNSQEEIMKVIKAQMPDIADEIAGTIAINIQRIFANMQLQTG